MAAKKKKKVGKKVGAPRIDNLAAQMDADSKGKLKLFRATDAPNRITARIATSSLVINRQLGGGISLPRITQFYGPSGVFKSTGVYDIIGNAQAMGLRCVLFDTEGASDVPYLRRWGIDPDALGMGGWKEETGDDGKKRRVQMNADEIVEQIIYMLRSDDPPEVICVDSLTGMLTEREISKGTVKERGSQLSFIDSQNKLQGWNGKFNSIAFKHINQANRGTTAIIFTNQIRDSIGDMVKAARNQGKQKATGGHAPKFFSSDIIYLEHEAADLGDYAKIQIGDAVRQRKKFKGWMISVFVEKTRTTANGNQELFFRFNPDKAEIDHIGEVIDLGRMDGIIEQGGGGNYKHDGKLIARGMPALRKTLRASQKRSMEMLANGEVPDEEIYYTLRKLIEIKTASLATRED